MPANNPLKAALAAAAISLAPFAAEATLMRAVPFDEKVEHSAAIVVGKCLRTESQWDASHRQILTYATFRIEKTIKGTPAPNQEMTIVTPGGRVGNVRQDSIGIPAFEEGDENLLFVRNSEVGPTVAYLEQGAYDIVTVGNERIVQPVETESVHIDEQRGVAVPAEEARPLRQFEGEVRAAEKRIAFQRMQMMQKKQKEESAIWPVVRKNALLIALALVGAALATWQFLRK